VRTGGNLREYLEFICKYFPNEVPGEPYAILGFISELGELATAYKKHFVQSLPLDRENICEELGDLLFHIVVLAYFKHGDDTLRHLERAYADRSEYLNSFPPIVDMFSASSTISQLEYLIMSSLKPIISPDLSAMFCLIWDIANQNGYSFDELLEYNMSKFAIRYPNGFPVTS